MKIQDIVLLDVLDEGKEGLLSEEGRIGTE